ncbi:cytochrome P450 monooxygenase pc-1 [Mycena albidolilacea]|uniref:Cytochrome P450 monooxygenase pc-1 n=1 Tax=Mycena albidolilacea TaxID=1033008 RepID=A0AAD7F3G9_9AGAR|nr:cytochrome P450 monooxygenase pc-1 [Mycena albidolilacea]
MYPHVTARLREEILAQVGPTDAPTYEDIKPMKYLRAVINGNRETIKATTWHSPNPGEKPIYIPAGVKFDISYFLLPCAEKHASLQSSLLTNEFDPERFINERAQRYLVANPFQFLPFNAGPRICLGQQISFVIIRLLQNFSTLSLVPDVAPPYGRVPADWRGKPGKKGIEQFRPRSHLTLYTWGGLWVKMKEV